VLPFAYTAKATVPQVPVLLENAEALRLDTERHVELAAVDEASQNIRKVAGRRLHIAAERSTGRNPGATSQALKTSPRKAGGVRPSIGGPK